MSSKTKQIIALRVEHPGWTSSQIAAEVGCQSEYVRTVWRRYIPKEGMSSDPRVSLAALADRQRRQAALAQRGLTAQLMGDPPPRTT